MLGSHDGTVAGDMRVRLRYLFPRLAFWIATGCATFVSASAVAADWTGLYAGIGLGGRWSDAGWTTDCLAPAALPATCPNDFFAGDTRIDNDNPVAFDDAAFRFSGYLGYNWQIWSFVLGVEGDGGWAGNRRSRTGIPGTWSADFGVGLETAKVESSWDASLRGRLGILVTPRLLVYSTGGVALLEQEVSASCEGSYPLGWCIVPNADSKSGTYPGWTAGGGAEWMVTPNWIARGEYRFTDFGSESFILLADEPIDSVGFSVEHNAHMAYIGLGYRF